MNSSAAEIRPLRVWNPNDPGAGTPEVTIIIVSYNTRKLTLKCLETLLAQGGDILAEVIVLDNDSADGSADAIRDAYPQVTLIESAQNLGFARANNVVAERANAPYLLLLNPDTETYDNAIANLVIFAKANPQAGIWGGRTLFPDGSLNANSCCNRITLRSQFMRIFRLDKIFPQFEFTNPEMMGAWKRDTVREVDIVVGCFLLITTKLWEDLGGFDLKYFMYGEEADLCLRAGERGYRPMITPDATIMHLVGAATSEVRTEKVLMVARARATLIRDHFPRWQVPFGIAFLWMWCGVRLATAKVLSLMGSEKRVSQRQSWATVWHKRHDWLQGY